MPKHSVPYINSRILNIIGDRIAQQILFKVPIVVQVNFSHIANICTNVTNCRLNPAQVNPTLIPAKTSNTTVLRYPQSILKQHMNLTSYLPDLQITFNSLVNWYFPDSLEHISLDIGNRFDFELIASREIAKGLGFISGLFYRNSAKGPYITPEIASTDSSRGIGTHFMPVTVFDSIVSQNRLTIAKSILGILQPMRMNVPEKLYLRFLELNDYTFILGSKLFGTITSRNSVIKMPGSPFRLKAEVGNVNTRIEFLLLDEYWPKEFLMKANTPIPSNSLRNLMRFSRESNAFGPKTLQIFEMMGYDTISQKSKLEFEIVDPVRFAFSSNKLSPLPGVIDIQDMDDVSEYGVDESVFLDNASDLGPNSKRIKLAEPEKIDAANALVDLGNS